MQQTDIPFDNRDRVTRLSTVKAIEYDLLVIGGGITGAGIALDASIRGMSTLLVEKGDFASGTSSKSTKLIHGGLRYLKQFEFSLVKETGLERAVAHTNIPHLVHPEDMLLPIVDKGTFGKLSASMAISVYDRLADVPVEDRKRLLSLEEVVESEPLLNKKILKSGIMYSEYRTDDARLTIELIKAARRESAEAFNYLQVEDFIYEDGKVTGVTCIDQLTNEQLVVKAKKIVSAAGPWVDELREKDGSKKGKSLQLTKGVHIVMPKEKLPIQSSVYFDAFDGRMLFVIPRGKITYAGTTDTVYSDDKNQVHATREDAEYILKAVNNMFEVETLTLDDVISSWSGLRPLIHEDGKSPSELSRKDEVFVSDTGLISIAGGKLTGFRKMAERVVDLVQELSEGRIQPCTTEDYAVQPDGYRDYAAFETALASATKNYVVKGMTAYQVWFMLTTYGKAGGRMIDRALRSEQPLAQALIHEEIQYCLQYESCFRPEDFFIRRTGRLYFDIESARNNMDFICSEFRSHFGWSEKETEVAKARAQELMTRDVAFLESSKYNNV